MRRLFRYLCIACLIVAACGNADKPVREFTIVYSGNIGGKYEPCGCHPPLGGYPRRATLVAALRNQYESPLMLDSGALMYDTNFLTPPTDYLKRLDAGLAVRAMDTIGIDAINVSSFDLSNSVDSLLVIDESMDAAWLSANLVWRENGELVFRPDMSFESNGVRIGVFGLMSNTFRGSPLFDDHPTIEVVDYAEAASRESAKLAAENDVVVALAYLSTRELETLVNDVDGIDIIIHSHNGFQNPSSDHGLFEPYTEDGTLVLRCPDGGRVLGVAEFALVGASTRFAKREQTPLLTAAEDERIAMLREQGSNYQHDFIDLGAEIRSDPVIQAMLDEVLPIREAYETELYLRVDE